MLGNFFKVNQNKRKREVIKLGFDHFSKYQAMVRPVESILGQNQYDSYSTLESGKVLLCQDIDEKSPWAVIIFIRFSEQIHSVLLPNIDSPRNYVKFEHFLKNTRTNLSVKDAVFSNGMWSVSSNGQDLFWPENINWSL
jgi:hypothetical protein